jgi:dipeptidyl-peptidase III
MLRQLRSYEVTTVTKLRQLRSYDSYEVTNMSEKHNSGELRDDFEWEVDTFADIKVLRYKVPGWEDLPLKDKKLAYYLIEAGRSGYDIIFDQNYKHNLIIRQALLAIWKSSKIDKTKSEWKPLETYIKQVFFANGIHHHYSNDKFEPEFTREYFETCLKLSGGVSLPEEVLVAIFDPSVDAKKVEQNEAEDVVAKSCVNFYGPGITRDEVTAFYANKVDSADPTPIAHGLNSKLVKVNGQLKEEPYCLNGLYGPAISKIIRNLVTAQRYAPPDMAEGLGLLIEYFTTGDLKKWDEYCIHWVSEGSNLVDYILGFIEVYNDPLGKRGSFESVVQIVDLDATKKMRVLQENAQYFEDSSPTFPQHKRENVTGITFNFINVASNGGDNAPASAIGINLPNSNWIRTKHGSKSVNLGNISHASDMSAGTGMMDEFSYSEEQKERNRKYGDLADTLHTALHEVIGHGSGQLEPGTKEHALEVYNSTIEEGRADLVALYYLMDPKMIEIGLMPSLDLGKQSYDDYIKNGLLVQLRRIKLGAKIEEAHMRNRHWISAWVYEKGQDRVIKKVQENGKTYFVIQDYEKLRTLFGELLREVQRIKSQGDLAAAKALVENYGVNIDQELHKEVLDRCSKLNVAPYKGYVQATYKLVFDEDGEIVDILHNKKKVGFMEQMVYFSEKYNYLK